MLLLIKNTSHRMSICQQTVSGLEILLKKIFAADFPSESWKNMTKILSCRFKQIFRPFNMLTVHKFFDTEFFRHLSKPGCCSLWFQKQVTSEAHLFCSKYSRFYVDARNAEKNSEIIFWFGDNCIWIDSVKHALLLRENTSHRVSIY